MRRIELGIRASMAWFHEHRSSFNLVQFAATEERFAPVVRHNREVAIADAVRHIKDGIVEGRIADQDPEVLAEAVVGVTERLAQAYLLERDEPVDQRRRRRGRVLPARPHGLSRDAPGSELSRAW